MTGEGFGLLVAVEAKWVLFTVTVLKPGPLGDLRHIGFDEGSFGSQLSLVGGLPPSGGQSRLSIGEYFFEF